MNVQETVNQELKIPEYWLFGSGTIIARHLANKKSLSNKVLEYNNAYWRLRKALDSENFDG